MQGRQRHRTYYYSPLHPLNSLTKMRFDKETISSITVTCSFPQSFHLIGLVKGKIKNERERKREKSSIKSNQILRMIARQYGVKTGRVIYCISRHQKHYIALEQERRDKHIRHSTASATQFEPCHMLFGPALAPKSITIKTHLKCLNLIVSDTKC